MVISRNGTFNLHNTVKSIRFADIYSKSSPLMPDSWFDF